jgi:hypothetical protein
LEQAEIAFRQGDLAGARSYLKKAHPVFSRPGADEYQKQELEKLEAAVSGHLVRK